MSERRYHVRRIDSKIGFALLMDYEVSFEVDKIFRVIKVFLIYKLHRHPLSRMALEFEYHFE